MNAVHLEVFYQMHTFLADIVGVSDTAAFVASLPYTLKSILARTHDQDTWIPSRDFSMWLAALDLQALPQLDKFFLRFGRVFVENHATCFGASSSHFMVFLFHRNPHVAILSLAKQLQSNFETLKTWFLPLNLAVDEKISLQMLRFHLAARPSPLPVFCELIMGITTGLLELYHVPYLRIFEENCHIEGHGICTFLIELESANPLSFM